MHNILNKPVQITKGPISIYVFCKVLNQFQNDMTMLGRVCEFVVSIISATLNISQYYYSLQHCSKGCDELELILVFLEELLLNNITL